MTAPHQPEILVVDEDEAIRNLLALALPAQGFVVHLAARGSEAIALYQEHHARIALVLLDVQGRILNGLTTLAALQGINPAVRCCFMTAGRDHTWDQLSALGAVTVLRKPLFLDELGTTLQKLVDLP